MTTGTTTLRLAAPDDIPALEALMDVAIRRLLEPFLPPEAVTASFEVMGLDTQLIADGTYYIAQIDGALAACGGWSKRATLFGGNHTEGRSAALLDPAADRARVRAMYTHPDFTRRGLGKLILETCETAARDAGFARCELAATLAGEPLYLAAGYVQEARFEAPTSGGVQVPLVRMWKALA